MPTLVTAYQDDIRLNLASPTFIGQQTGLVGASWSQWFNVTSPVANKRVLAASFEFTSYLTATATVATQVNNPAGQAIDVLDEFLDQLQVGPAPNANARSSIETRESAEEVERICFNLPYSYPRPAPHSFTATAGTASDSAVLLVPIGGPAASVRVHVPSITGVYTASVTGTVSVTVHAIIGSVSTVITFQDGQTGQLAVGRNDLSNYFPANLSPDYLSMVGDTVTSVTTMFVTGQNGAVIVDIDSAGLMGAMQAAIAPATTKSAGFNTLAFSLQKARFRTIRDTLAVAEAQQLLWVSFDGGEVAPTPAPAAATPSTPAYSNVGYPLAGAMPATSPTGAGSVGTLASGSSGRIVRRPKS